MKSQRFRVTIEYTQEVDPDMSSGTKKHETAYWKEHTDQFYEANVKLKVEKIENVG